MLPLEDIDPALSTALQDAVDDVGLRASDRLAAAHDASHYLLTPQAVVQPASIMEMRALFDVARHNGVPLTFRSGGTSLSGQAVTDALLVDTRRRFRDIAVSNDGATVRCGPGAVLQAVNARLARHGRKLGPDPASEIACTIGGVVANNSSGMACGIEANTYRTLDSLVLVLPSGTVVDTGIPDADAVLRRDEPRIHSSLKELRDELRSDQNMVARIEELHSIKNTMGYGLNSFLDFDEPVKILERLCVGSEGTLGFLAEATFRTLPVKPHTATGLLIFEDLDAATAALPRLAATGAVTIELMDATSLLVAQRDPASPEEILALKVHNHCALLMEFQEQEKEELIERLEVGAPVWAGLPLTTAVEFTTDRARRAAFWRTRKGLFAAVAGSRKSGTTALLEDIAVPLNRLGETCRALTTLFNKYGYADAVIFGHAKDGNIHFMITEEFADHGQGVARYKAFTEDMVDAVLSRGGTLKAEHGTGRVMAPFVPRQVGKDLYQVMWRIKNLLDPDNLLNPGVLLTADPETHLRHLKTTPEVEEEVNRCVECGYCEPVCPSKDLTTTPRERIVLRREIARAEAAGETGLAATLREEYQYDSIDTCAVDGMCETACPVFINTGDLVRRLREENSTRLQQHAWNTAAQSWGTASRAGALALTVSNMVPSPLPTGTSAVARSVLGAETVPLYTKDLPPGGRRRSVIRHPQAEFVWFSSCTNTMFGANPESDIQPEAPGVAGAFRRLCAQAGIALRTPRDIPALCCGTPWKSKGQSSGYQQMRTKVLKSLNDATVGGSIPVVSDASSCTEGLESLLADSELEVIDAVAFTADTLLPALTEKGLLPIVDASRIPSLALHPTCSSTRGGSNAALTQIAEAVSGTVYIPDSWSCCGFAGDRGMLRPELTASATAVQAVEVREFGAHAHASTNRTCEIGMSRATGEPYRHIIEILEDVTT
ncbi:FAD-binding and (Fe-S)-binding domain-containing protein [Nesterenkonia sphaerica]|uniref:D-lactate dehydrogenase (cytochrome) n=1 Tax=Nesterenkonia sphaerica TaxID=1804988 RepID=A0A5R9AMN5_9MICC|nr:FAD-binding oxidoreductase [Nesterenkonia sphaerica]